MARRPSVTRDHHANENDVHHGYFLSAHVTRPVISCRLYVAEFEFTYNNRENADIFGQAIKGC